MNALLVSGLLLVAMLLFIEAGYRVGRRRRRNSPETSDAGSGTVDAAVFGLMGLILAFTFSGAATRLETRRAQIVQEANNIGTAYLRLDLLPASDQPELRRLFRQYLDTRLEVYEKLPDRRAAMEALGRANHLQSEIWNVAVRSCQADTKTTTCMLLLPALNEMIDITTTRYMATTMHTPTVITALLVILSLLGALLAGFAMSPQVTRSILHNLLFALAVTASVYVVLDLEYPRFGLINLKNTDMAMYMLRDTIK
jgi:hypothetical protein